MIDKCNVEGCNRDCFQESQQCVLHCEKNTYDFDRDNNRILSKFYNEISEYIVSFILEYHDAYTSYVDFKNYLLTGAGPKTFKNYFQEPKIIFNSICFPARDDRDPFDYLSVLNKLGNIQFNDCKFTATSLDMPDVKVFYQDCMFHSKWHLTNSAIIDNADYAVYQACIFKEKVCGKLEDDLIGVNNCLFKDCTFHKELSFKNMTFEKKIFQNENSKINMHSLLVSNCVIHEKFILNNLNAKSVVISNSEFKSKFEIKYGNISNLKANNVNFKGLFDAHGSKFGVFKSIKCIFSDFVGFERCEFSSQKKDDSGISIFEYTTFLSFANFRNATFHNGLDLETVNLKEAPNFLNIELLSDNTNRETLRIIKNSFDKIGNHIDANEFFVKEMKKYKRDLAKTSGNIQEKIILWFNEIASNFGQSYVRPIIGIFLVAMFYSGLIYAQENNYLDCVYKISPSLLNVVISAVVQFSNIIAKNIIPFKSFAKEGMEFLSLIFYIIFASLTWQTIVAFKRHTKR